MAKRKTKLDQAIEALDEKRAPLVAQIAGYDFAIEALRQVRQASEKKKKPAAKSASDRLNELPASTFASTR